MSQSDKQPRREIEHTSDILFNRQRFPSALAVASNVR